jgi:hypothetical protein
MLKIPNLGTNVERAATTYWPASGWNRLESSDILRNSLPSDRHGCRAGFELPITMIELYYDLNPFLNLPRLILLFRANQHVSNALWLASDLRPCTSQTPLSHRCILSTRPRVEPQKTFSSQLDRHSCTYEAHYIALFSGHRYELQLLAWPLEENQTVIAYPRFLGCFKLRRCFFGHEALRGD